MYVSKATDYFSHMLRQRRKAKVCQKGSSPQMCLKLTTTGHESDMLTTEPPGRDSKRITEEE